MLKSLHVKNLALIEEEEIEFTEGLNILSGETGAGKSIILGALGLALGNKAEKGFIRGESEALVEAVFSVGEREKALLDEMDIDVYDDEVILTRKLTSGRSTAKVNGETCPAPFLKKVSDLLLAIYGQSEHEFIRKKSRQLAMVDAYCGEEAAELLQKVAASYEEYRKLTDELEGSDSTDSERERELSFLRHETKEIEEAALQPGEDIEVEADFQKMKNAEKIQEAIAECYGALSSDGGAADLAGRAAGAIARACEYDNGLEQLSDTLRDAESILSEASRSISDYMGSFGFDQRAFNEITARLDLINDLKSKYGRPKSREHIPGSIEAVLDSLSERKERMEKLLSYDTYITELKAKRDEAKSRLDALCGELSDLRQNKAKSLSEKVQDALLDLNFLDVRFETRFSRAAYGSDGFDETEFYISLNPGAPLSPLSKVASGGELSRIMLAFKTILADREDVGTMIFDEIDTGISGRTANAVARRLREASASRQVICITHLPQIAAAADTHFLIEKSATADSTVSTIRPLSSDESINELARMLGGDTITEATLANARELRSQIK